LIGSGPWIFEEWIPEQILRLKRNPEYWEQPLPYGDEWQGVTITDLQTGQAAFRTGQVLHNRTNDQITRLLRGSVPDLQIAEAKLFGAASGDRLWMSPLKDFTRDQRVRQALGMLFDRPAIIRDVLFGTGWITSGLFLPSFDWHLPESELNQWLAFDVQKARQLFQAAGVDPNSWKPVLDFGIPTPDSTNPTSEAYASTLKQVGIDATLKVVDKVEITDKIWLRADTEFCVCNKPTFSGTNGELNVFYHSNGRFAAPYKQLGDTQLDQLIEQQAAELDPERRRSILANVQRRVLETAIATPVYSRTNTEAVHPKLRDWKNNPQDYYTRNGAAWLAS
jgi:ABC-type transport system substrate-binding protein